MESTLRSDQFRGTVQILSVTHIANGVRHLIVGPSPASIKETLRPFAIKHENVRLEEFFHGRIIDTPASFIKIMRANELARRSENVRDEYSYEALGHLIWHRTLPPGISFCSCMDGVSLDTDSREHWQGVDGELEECTLCEGARIQTLGGCWESVVEKAHPDWGSGYPQFGAADPVLLEGEFLYSGTRDYNGGYHINQVSKESLQEDGSCQVASVYFVGKPHIIPQEFHDILDEENKRRVERASRVDEIKATRREVMIQSKIRRKVEMFSVLGCTEESLAAYRAQLEEELQERMG